MSVRVQSILALKCYIVAFGDLENVRHLLNAASGPSRWLVRGFCKNNQMTRQMS